jgi:hypothetical protein
VVGIKRQHARGVLEGLKKKNVMRFSINKCDGSVRLKLNKYYKKWKVTMSGEWSLYDTLINLNNPAKSTVEDELCNLEVTEDMIKADQVVNDVTCGLHPVTYRLHDCHLQVTSTEVEPALSQASTDAKDRKDSLKTTTTIGSNITTTSTEEEKTEEEVVVALDKKEEKKESEPPVLTIKSDATIVEGAILAKYRTQIMDKPPSPAKLRDALESYRVDQLTEAIDRMPVILKPKDPKTTIDGDYVLSLACGAAKNTHWWRTEEVGVVNEKKTQTEAERAVDWLRYCKDKHSRQCEIYPTLEVLAAETGRPLLELYAENDYLIKPLDEYKRLAEVTS